MKLKTLIFLLLFGLPTLAFSQRWRLGGNTNLPAADDITIPGANIFGSNAGFNIAIDFRTNGNTRMLMANGGIGNNAGQIAMGNNLPVGFAAVDRLHLHQNGGTVATRFTNNTTGATATDGFQVGITALGTGVIQNYTPNRAISLGTNNNAAGVAYRLRVYSYADNGFVALGNVNNFASPLAALHIMMFNPNMANTAVRGEVFRTDGDNTVTNAWRLFTGPNSFGSTEKFSASVPSGTSNAVLQATNGDLYFNTFGAAGVQERVHVSSGIGNQVGVPQPGATKVNIDYGAGFTPIVTPVALLNLGFQPPVGPNGGQRNWMDVGTFTCGGSENMYIGLKNEDPNGIIDPLQGADRMDAVINWGDNNGTTPPFGPDRLRFIFTNVQNPATATGAASNNGLEFMRMLPVNNTTAYVGVGGDPAVNLYSGALIDPGNTLEVNSMGGTNVAGGSSGLRFTNLTAASPNTPNVANGNVLSVNANGDVILVPGGAGSVTGAHNGTSLSTITPTFVCFGQDVAQAGNPGSLLSNREVPLNNFNIQFNDGGAPAVGFNRLSIGQIAPVGISAKVYVRNNIEQIGQMTHTDAANIPQPSGPQPTLVAHDGFITGVNNQSVIAIGSMGVSYNVVSKSNIGLEGVAMEGQAQNIGVHGIVPSNSTGTGQNIGGSFEALSPNGTQNIGITAFAPINPLVNYAAEFNGDMNFNGTLYGTNNVLTSDQMFKTNVDTIGGALSIIAALTPHTYFLDTVNTLGMNFPSARQYGLIAQEVETVLPELVGTGATPTYFDSTTMTQYNSVQYRTLNYNSFIAILIKGIQEQQVQIDSLQSQVSACCSSNARSASTSTNQQDVTLTNSESVVLNQNVPNPFAEQTTITYYLPESAVRAQLLFYDATGKLIKAIDVTGRGNGQVNVFADDLSNGIYSYALVVDGQVADTKKMVKTQ